MSAAGDYHRAVELKREGVALARRAGDPVVLVMALNNLASEEQRLGGNYAEARVLLEEALAIQEPQWTEAHAELLLNLAEILLLLDDLQTATIHFRASLAALHAQGERATSAWALAGLAKIAFAAGDVERAARLLAAAEGIHDRIGFVGVPAIVEVHRDQTSELRVLRGDPCIDAAWREGEEMTVDEAVAYALSDES